MKTKKEIYDDLKQIRYYYKNKMELDYALKKIDNKIVYIVDYYNQVIKFAPIDLYYIYIKLYIECYTQEALSEEMNITAVHASGLNTKLINYFLKIFN